MITFNKEFDKHTVQRTGGTEEWLNTIRALLAAIDKQDPEQPLSSSETKHLCWLIEDMLPSDKQVFEMEQRERELLKISSLMTELSQKDEVIKSLMDEALTKGASK